MASFPKDVDRAWRLLRCGGSIAGDGYAHRAVRPVVDALAARTGSVLKAGWVHGPGTRWEPGAGADALFKERQKQTNVKQQATA